MSYARHSVHSATRLLVLLVLIGCEVPQRPCATQAPAPTVVAARAGCREDIPDCVAACSLREAGRTEYVEWFDERCAAAILGKNPDRTAGKAPLPSSTRSVEPNPYEILDGLH